MVGDISIQNIFTLLMVLLPKPLKVIILWTYFCLLIDRWAHKGKDSLSKGFH